MSNRTLRVNELIQRELSDILRKRYQSESVTITITEVRVAPDLRDARVFISVMGSDEDRERKLRWLRTHARDIREELGRRIVLKYLPRFEYVADNSMEKGTRILQMLDEIDRQSPLPEPTEDGEAAAEEPPEDRPAP
ncbi:MAG TPA: 30S ribosome-binding factor RbfA [Opitutus sp.]|nr:30S ribosome-binding factor RbfA [Opitutus sp.]